MRKNLDIKSQPDIVLKAFKEGITDIGQITSLELKALKKAVKEGYLAKIPDFNYPVTKNRYVMNLENYDILTSELREH